MAEILAEMDALLEVLQQDLEKPEKPKKEKAGEPQTETLRLVVQRTDRASLEVGNPPHEETIGRGLVFYIGFDQGCDESKARRAARRALRLRIISLLEWNDDTIKKSVLEILNEKKQVGICVVPQVSLSNRISSTTNRLNAAKACSPEEAKHLYGAFIDEIQSEVGKHGDTAAKSEADLQAKIARIQAGPVSPQEMFKSGDWAGQFSSHDDKGMPILDNTGKKLSSKRLKKYTKLYKKQCAKYEKWIGEGNQPVKQVDAGNTGAGPARNNKLFKLVYGDFGARQALKFEDTQTIDCGPNTTFLQF